MTNSILAQQIGELQRAVGERISYFDINWEVVPSNPSPRRTTVLRNERAVINAYKIWLLSRRDDYVRNQGFGGFFDNHLNDRFKFSPDSEGSVKQALIEETNAKWPDIELLDVHVKCVMEDRRWRVKVAVMDRHTRLVDTSMFEYGDDVVLSGVV